MTDELATEGNEPLLKSLGLAGDMDDVDLVVAIEQAFGISFENQELERCLTVGDLYALTLKRFPDAGDRGGACLAAGAFYRLRRAVRGMYPNAAVRLDASVRAMVRDTAARDIWASVGARDITGVTAAADWLDAVWTATEGVQ